jgi:hypothetical protein
MDTWRNHRRDGPPAVYAHSGWLSGLPADLMTHTSAHCQLDQFRDRVDGVVEVLTGHSLRHAEPSGSGVRLHLEGPEQSSTEVDHVIAGAGFRIDVSRLSFLSAETQASLDTRANCPLVNRAGESARPPGFTSRVRTGPTR